MTRTARGRLRIALWPAIAGLMVLAGCQGAQPFAAVSPSPSPSLATPRSPAAPSPTISPSSSPSPAAGDLRPGARGPEVLALQNRLVALGFWLGTPDGRYGGSTTHAVTAFQKAQGLRRDGVAGPATRAALQRVTPPEPRSSTGRLIEIDLRRQLLLLVSGGRVQWVLDTSTGAVAGTTPRGRFTIYREVNGYRHAPLGVLYRPKYFHEGVAVHGYTNVPPYPASHGCVRVTYAAMDWLWSSDAMPLGTPVWVY